MCIFRIFKEQPRQARQHVEEQHALPFELLPITWFRLASTCAQQRNGGGERDRTDDLLLAKQALSQLSYTPEICGGSGWT